MSDVLDFWGFLGFKVNGNKMYLLFNMIWLFLKDLVLLLFIES